MAGDRAIPGNAMTTRNFDSAALRRRLGERRVELEQLLERVRSNIGRGLDPDSKERAKELEDSDVVDALGNEARSELNLIRATLERLEAGEYGRCSDCGEDIGRQRLQAYPYAYQCIDCATEQERAVRRHGTPG